MVVVVKGRSTAALVVQGAGRRRDGRGGGRRRRRHPALLAPLDELGQEVFHLVLLHAHEARLTQRVLIDRRRGSEAVVAVLLLRRRGVDGSHMAVGAAAARLGLVVVLLGGRVVVVLRLLSLLEVLRRGRHGEDRGGGGLDWGLGRGLLLGDARLEEGGVGLVGEGLEEGRAHEVLEVGQVGHHLGLLGLGVAHVHLLLVVLLRVVLLDGLRLLERSATVVHHHLLLMKMLLLRLGRVLVDREGGQGGGLEEDRTRLHAERRRGADVGPEARRVEVAARPGARVVEAAVVLVAREATVVAVVLAQPEARPADMSRLARIASNAAVLERRAPKSTLRLRM